MYYNIEFRKKIEPFKENHRHGDTQPNFKLKSVTTSQKEGPPLAEEKDHVICQICGRDLTHLAKLSKVDLSEEYIPA